MRSNYKKIGKFVQQVKNKNNDNSRTVEHLRGINITKEFMPSVANVTGTDLSVYKIVEKNQFAYNPMHVGRDEILPISMLVHEDSVIVSPAYVVFEIVDTNELLPEYLMMWCRRSEFDRNAWFTTDSSVRGGFNWEDFCDLEIPVPSIEKQKELIKEYHTITDRIKLNEQLNQKLEDAAQSIYKEWFVNFEFPDENGKPYKSNGGEMVYCEELEMEVPKGWYVNYVNTLVTFIDGDRGNNYPKQEDFFHNEYCLFLNAGNVTKIGFNFENNSFITIDLDKQLRKGKLTRGDIVITSRGTVGNIAFYNSIIPFENIRINSGMVIVRTKLLNSSSYMYELLKSEFMKQQILNFISGSAQPQLPIKDLNLFLSLIPDTKTIERCNKILNQIHHNKELKSQENLKLINLKNVLLSKIATIEG